MFWNFHNPNIALKASNSKSKTPVLDPASAQMQIPRIVGALKSIGFWGPLYYIYTKEPPK